MAQAPAARRLATLGPRVVPGALRGAHGRHGSARDGPRGGDDPPRRERRDLDPVRRRAVACLVMLRGAARAGLASTERRTAATAALEARSVYLDALGRGATARAGAASTFVTTSADDIGEYIARPSRQRSSLRLPLGVLLVVAIIDPWSALIAVCVLAVVPRGAHPGRTPLTCRGRGRRSGGCARSRPVRSSSSRAPWSCGHWERGVGGATSGGRDGPDGGLDATLAAGRPAFRGMRSTSSQGSRSGSSRWPTGFDSSTARSPSATRLAAVLLTVEVFAPLRAAGAAFHAGADGTGGARGPRRACDAQRRGARRAHRRAARRGDNACRRRRAAAAPWRRVRRHRGRTTSRSRCRRSAPRRHRSDRQWQDHAAARASPGAPLVAAGSLASVTRRRRAVAAPARRALAVRGPAPLPRRRDPSREPPARAGRRARRELDDAVAALRARARCCRARHGVSTGPSERRAAC